MMIIAKIKRVTHDQRYFFAVHYIFFCFYIVSHFKYFLKFKRHSKRDIDKKILKSKFLEFSCQQNY